MCIRDSANTERLQALQDRLDIRTVRGHASYPTVLEQAGIADADMLIALTDSDEANMIACQIAHTLYNTPTKIARVRAGSYTAYRDQLFKDDALPGDCLFSPSRCVSETGIGDRQKNWRRAWRRDSIGTPGGRRRPDRDSLADLSRRRRRSNSTRRSRRAVAH